MGHVRILKMDDGQSILHRLSCEGIKPTRQDIDKIVPCSSVLLIENEESGVLNLLKKEILFHGGSVYYGTENSLLLSGKEEVYRLLVESMEEIGGEASVIAMEIKDVMARYRKKEFTLSGKDFSFDLSKKTHIMGILNVTPDSFSDGGLFLDEDKALAQAGKMVEEGADIIDIGGESTRPGANPVTAQEEKKRVVSLIEKLSKEIQVPISIDTYKSEVARAALDMGARIVNDISGLRFDQDMAKLAAEKDVPVIIMHMKGTLQEMQDAPSYDSVMGEIYCFLKDRIAHAVSAGIRREKIVVDPGIGFGKRVSDNLEILNSIDELKGLGCPILLGTSRKSFIGKILDLPEGERLEGTAATAAVGILKGVQIIRVHDVSPMVRFARMIDAIKNSDKYEGSD